jgi:hypothetical protein
MFCHHCGAPLPTGAAFCPKCGKGVRAGLPVVPRQPQRASRLGRRGRLLLVIGLSAVAVIGILTAEPARPVVSTPSSGRSTSTDRLPSNIHRVTYRVDGATIEASITYTNSQGGTEQIAEQELLSSWSHNILASRGDFVYLSAQNRGDFGSVSCEILIDDKTFKFSRSQGGHTIATCSGSVP